MEMTDHQFPTEVIPMGAVVTASGTGAEMNGGAVITNEEKVIKAGMAAARPGSQFWIRLIQRLFRRHR